MIKAAVSRNFKDAPQKLFLVITEHTQTHQNTLHVTHTNTSEHTSLQRRSTFLVSKICVVHRLPETESN